MLGEVVAVKPRHTIRFPGFRRLYRIEHADKHRVAPVVHGWFGAYLRRDVRGPVPRVFNTIDEFFTAPKGEREQSHG